MKFTITTQEINAAIIAYLPTLGITQGDRSVTVVMAVKRGDGGYSASIGLDEPVPVKAEEQYPEEQYPEERDDLESTPEEDAADEAEVTENTPALDPNGL